jgi:hypothetical protein
VASPDLTLAVAVEQRVRGCPGIAGLDPASRLVTVGRDRQVRGIHTARDAGGPVLRVDLVGLSDARLHEAADVARGAILAEVTAAGVVPQRLEVRISDVAEAVLPLQAPRRPARATPLDAGVGRPPEPAPPPPAPPPAPAPVATSEPLPAPQTLPPPPPAGSPAPTRVRIRVPGPDGRDLTLVVTVEVEQG